MNFNSDTKTLKDLSYKCIFDKFSKMSGRVTAAVIFVVIRAGEIIDWWFPVKVSSTVKSN